jgi:hypothetical protein
MDEKEPQWGKERGNITVNPVGNVWVNAGKENPLFPCLAGCGALSSVPTNPARPEWGWLCSDCANERPRRGSQNSTGFSVLHQEKS